MNIQLASRILEMNFMPTTPKDKLKQQYRKMALKYHPDKHKNSQQSTIHFTQIQEAYLYLLDTYNDKIDDQWPVNYHHILEQFILSSFNGSYYSNTIDRVVAIIQSIVFSTTLTHTIFDKMDKETATDIYLFANNNQHILNISDEIIELLRKIVCEKYENVMIIKLSPSLSDLFNHNIYSLKLENECLLVPLWHNEMYFDSTMTKNEIIVICNPMLSPNMEIDADNHLHVSIHITFDEISELFALNKQHYDVYIYDKLTCSVPLCQLTLQPTQQYVFQNSGICKIRQNIYDITQRANIIINISIGEGGHGKGACCPL